MKESTSSTPWSGLALVGFGLFLLAMEGVSRIFGYDFSILNFWPILVIGAGMAFVLPPFIWNHKRGLAGLFIPGMPILIVGIMLMVASLFNWWSLWDWAWPAIVMAVALGFTLAGIYMRVVWLFIPAMIIGLNGLVFQFTAVTGWWESWSVLWTIEPLSIGLALLLVGSLRHKRALVKVGFGLSLLAGLAFAGMTLLMSGGLIGSMLLIGCGVLLLNWNRRQNKLLDIPEAKQVELIG